MSGRAATASLRDGQTAVPRKSPSVLCLGAAVMDTVFLLPELPSRSGKYLPVAGWQFAAGMASSAAVTIARLGGKTALWACVGDDRNGAAIIAELSREGVDCKGVRVLEGVQSAFCTTIVDAEGERIIMPFYEHNLRPVPDWFDFECLDEIDVVLTDVRWQQGAMQLLEVARDRGIPTVLDADVVDLSVLDALVPLATYPIFSEPAALKMSGESSVDAALDTLSQRFGSFVAVTAGPRGCFWKMSPSATSNRQDAPAINAVDTLSAGDVFHGAFALAIAEKKSMSWAITFGTAAAALKCTRRAGRLGAPCRNEVEAFVREWAP